MTTPFEAHTRRITAAAEAAETESRRRALADAAETSEALRDHAELSHRFRSQAVQLASFLEGYQVPFDVELPFRENAKSTGQKIAERALHRLHVSEPEPVPHNSRDHAWVIRNNKRVPYSQQTGLALSGNGAVYWWEQQRDGSTDYRPARDQDIVDFGNVGAAATPEQRAAIELGLLHELAAYAALRVPDAHTRPPVSGPAPLVPPAPGMTPF